MVKVLPQESNIPLITDMLPLDLCVMQNWNRCGYRLLCFAIKNNKKNICNNLQEKKAIERERVLDKKTCVSSEVLTGMKTNTSKFKVNSSVSFLSGSEVLVIDFALRSFKAIVCLGLVATLPPMVSTGSAVSVSFQESCTKTDEAHLCPIRFRCKDREDICTSNFSLVDVLLQNNTEPKSCCKFALLFGLLLFISWACLSS